MKKKSLSRKMLTSFVACIAVLLALATPLFYFLTKNYYAEDMIDIMEAVDKGQPVPAIDLEEDIMEGVMVQFGIIIIVLAVAIVLTVRFISHRLWQPFDKTLELIENFRLEDGKLPTLPETDVTEFARMNNVLLSLMQNSLNSYRMQKEFTENASHELQTPLAVFQSKLDILLQQPGLTEKQAEMIQGLYDVSIRLARLNRNLLLLAKIDNRQYEKMEDINLNDFLREQTRFLENVADGIVIHEIFNCEPLNVKANRSLLESLVNNLVINAVRHNRPGGEITITIAGSKLVIANTSDEPELDEQLIFNRFYRPSEKVKGNGLGLAIVQAICCYHGWKVAYRHTDGMHCFSVDFLEPSA